MQHHGGYPGRLKGGLVMGCMALLLMGGMVQCEEASCARRIRGEGQESTLVILKPDAVANPRPRRARRRATGAPRRACERAEARIGCSNLVDRLTRWAVSPGGPRACGRGHLALRASRAGARRDTGAWPRCQELPCKYAPPPLVCLLRRQSLPVLAAHVSFSPGRRRQRRPQRFSRNTTLNTPSGSSTRYT
jgi:hypothetical protein